MDSDLKSIAAARQCVESAFKAYQEFLGTDPSHVDAIVDAMAQAIEPEAKNLGQLAVDETGYGNVEDKRIKNLFNALSVADYLRDVTTLGNVVARRSHKGCSVRGADGGGCCTHTGDKSDFHDHFQSAFSSESRQCNCLCTSPSRFEIGYCNSQDHGKSSRTNGGPKRSNPMP